MQNQPVKCSICLFLQKPPHRIVYAKLGSDPPWPAKVSEVKINIMVYFIKTVNLKYTPPLYKITVKRPTVNEKLDFYFL